VLYGLAAKLKQFPDGVTLGRGDPDFDTPQHIRDAVRTAIENPSGAKSVAKVRAELHQAIAARLKAINGIDVDPETEIVLTQGGQEALVLMSMTALAPGDEIIIAEPNYSSYADAIRMAGAVRVPIKTAIDDNFTYDPERVRAAITPRTRAIVMVSPNNPTAAVLPPDAVRALCRIAEEHDLLILADDIYDRFLYEGAVHTSPASLPGMKARTMTLNALSKSYAMTGWRLGWVAGPAPLMRQLKQVKEAMSGDISTLSLYAGLAALTGPQQPLHDMVAAYTRRRKIVMDAFDKMRLPYGRPMGGQFLLADIRSVGMPAFDFVVKMVDEAHVLVYPGISFGEDWTGFVRATFLQPEEVLRDAFARMADFVEKVRR
jgi:aspartate/methionine/tyrosine aminotransferase